MIIIINNIYFYIICLRKCVTRRRHQGPLIRSAGHFHHTELSLLTATTGLDLCGPFFVRSTGDGEKTYIALFTCSTTRAVHLELVPSIATPLLRLALRRFLTAAPGCRRLVTDNARTKDNYSYI